MEGIEEHMEECVLATSEYYCIMRGLRYCNTDTDI